MSLYLQEAHGVAWLNPILGAMAAAVIAGIIIGMVSMYAKEREDTVIGAVWAIGMALGLLLISRTPGYVDPMSYLFGNILILSQRELILIAVLDVVVIAVGVLGYNQFQAVAFDEEFARVRGVHTTVFYLAMILMTALSIVLLTTIVGLIMVIAMFTLPAAVGAMLARRLWKVMLLATLFTMVFTTLGLGLSYTYDLPSGPTIIAFAGGVYLLATGVKSILKRRA
jgi:zinc transport system permease protein